jgi:hypothetical protein
MNPEQLPTELEQVTWETREFVRHKTALKTALVEVVKNDHNSFSRKIQVGLGVLFMNKKIIITVGLVMLVVLGGELGSAFLRKNPTTLPIAKVLVPDVEAQALVGTALQKIEEVTRLTPNEQEKVLQQKIKQGLNEKESGDSSIYEKWSMEERVKAFQLMYKNVEHTLAEARQAQDLKVIHPPEGFKDILMPLSLISYDTYYFNAWKFNYSGPLLGARIESKDDEVISSEFYNRRKLRYQRLGYATSTVEELMRPTRKDEKADFIVRGDLNTDISFTFRSLPPEVDRQSVGVQFGLLPSTTVVYFTNPDGSPTIVWFDEDGLPTQVLKGIVHNDQIRDIMQQNLEKIVERIPYGYDSATLTPAQAEQELFPEHNKYEWQFLGLEWDKVSATEKSFNFRDYSSVDMVKRYIEKRTTGATVYVWIKDGQAILAVKRFPGKIAL